MKCLLLLLLGSLSAFGQAFSPSDLPFRDQAGGTDWARRVVANGGAQPSANTVAAMETLRTTLIAQGITNKIYSLCIFVPDSVIAATTPLFKHFGSDPWTNFNFAVSNLTINGLKGDGTSKVLDTGVKPKDVQLPASGATIGLSVVVTESASNEANITAGYQDADNNPLTALLVSSAGVCEWYATETVSATRVSTNDFARVGYVSGNRTTNGGTTNIVLYVASPLESHKILASTSGNISAVSTVTEVTFSVFANKFGGTNRSWTSQRLSMACVHDGFTETESSNFWWAVKTCRESLGGGTGDNVHDWNRKIVAAGGADISTTTSNASRTLYAGLDSFGLLYSMIAVSGLPPDSITAARTPLIWQAGSEVWTNFNFAASNLTVGGLTGNGTSKYFGLGIRPSLAVARNFGTTSAGMTVVISTNNGESSTFMGALPNAANVDFRLIKSSTQLSFFCWRNDLNGTNTVIWTFPVTNWISYVSGNRTAANALNMYVASTTTTHTNAVTSGVGNQTGTVTANNTNLLAFAHNNNNTPGSFVNSTLSFLAIHSGLTQVQSSNFYTLIHNYRTSLGGGSP